MTQCYNDLCIALVVVCKENKTNYYHRFVSIFIKTYGVMSQFIKIIWCNVTINQKYSKIVMMSSRFAPVVLNCSYSYTGPFISTNHTLQSYHTSFHHATHTQLSHSRAVMCQYGLHSQFVDMTASNIETLKPNDLSSLSS